MFQVDSYLMKPKCNVIDLRDVVKNPQNYFVEITDLKGLNAIHKNLDFQYLNGAICLKYYGESMLDMKYWDLVDQLWAYIMNLVDDVLLKSEGSVYFPDQPVKIIFRQASKDLLIFSVEGSETSSFVLPKNDFLSALVHGAEQFFTCMTNTFGSDCDYSHELERIDRLKQELQ